jgi:exportin-7
MGMLGLLQDASDGELAARVFSLLQVIDSGYHQQRYGEKSRQRLDLALLSFFQNFRRVYVGETVMHASKVSVFCDTLSKLSSGIVTCN